LETLSSALCFLLVTACTTNSSAANRATPPPEASTTAVEPDAARAPLLVRWQVLSDTGGTLRVSAVVTRKAKFRVPIDVQVNVPEGLRLVSGETSFQLGADLQPGETVAALEFTYTTIPQGDLQLVASASGPGMGVRAADAYRFGRPEPVPPRPQATGPAVKVGNVNLGPSIPLDGK
jgi:hypothetical protein